MTAAAYLAEAFRVPGSDFDYRERAYLLVNQVAAVLLIIVLSPMFVVVAILLWRADGLPILFAHHRVGRGGILFPCFKFRTMIRNADRVLADHLANDPLARARWQRDHKLAMDPRVTPIGRVLRRTSLDELPQLFNVLRGEMMLVGPRPITAIELQRYGVVRWHYLSVRPGMTGLWQISGRSSVGYDDRVMLDRYYVERRNPVLDIVILFKTIRVVVDRDGAH